MAVCAKDCSISLTGLTQTSTKQFDLSLSMTGNLIDVTGYGDGEFGDWLACTKEGELTVSSFDYLGDIDSCTGFSINVGGTTLAGPCVGRDFNVTATVGDAAKFVYTFRLTGDLV